MQKRCASCKEIKEASDFHKRVAAKDGLHTYCKVCTKHRNKAWALANKEKHAATCADWYKRNKESASARSTAWHYKKYYGLTKEELVSLYQAVNGKCEICHLQVRLKGPMGRDKIAVDHNHSSGKIRGVLCSTCNTGLGHFRDSIEALQNAIEYLKRKG